MALSGLRFPSLQHAWGDCGEDLRHSRGALDMFRSHGKAANFFYVATGFLDSDDVGMSREFDDQLLRHIVVCKAWNAVDEYGYGGAVGDGAIERKLVRRVHLRAIKVRRSDERNVIAELGGVVGQTQCLGRGLSASAGN